MPVSPDSASAMPLHPDLEAFLDLVNHAPGRRPMDAMSVDEARAAYDLATLSLDLPGPEMPVQDLTIAARDGHELPLRLYRGAAGQNLPVLLFFHGGGYVLGGLDSHDALCRSLAALAGCAVLAVDYRRAPEHRFPTAFHDAQDAAAWLNTSAAGLGLDPARVALGGDSVGGTLATALAISARDAGLSPARLQLLLYPCTAARQDSVSHRRFAQGFLLEHSTLQWMFEQALRTSDDRLDWRFAPLQAADLRDVAPAFITLADHDPLLDEGLAYGERLARAGVPTEVKVYRGMVHDFARLGQIVDEAALLRQDAATALRSAFAARPTTGARPTEHAAG